MKTLTSKPLASFLNEIKDKPFENLFFIAVFTGMRQAELLGLTWDCIDFQNGQISVVKQLKRERKLTHENEYRFDSLKNGKSRVIVPAPVVFEALRKVKKIQTENRLKHGTEYDNKDNLVFTDDVGSHLCHPTVWRQFKKRVSAIGCPDLRFHDLRHAFVSIAHAAGLPDALRVYCWDDIKKRLLLFVSLIFRFC